MKRELDTLSANFDNVAVVNALRQAAYAKGFTDGTLLREFCEDYTPETYFPMADSRPAAERLQWAKASTVTTSAHATTCVLADTVGEAG